jgi:hypothetical protein
MKKRREEENYEEEKNQKKPKKIWGITLLLCFPYPRLLMSDLRTVWPVVSRDTTIIASRLTSFAEMLLKGLCKFKISIFTNNKALTSLRYIPLMGRNIFI